MSDNTEDNNPVMFRCAVNKEALDALLAEAGIIPCDDSRKELLLRIDSGFIDYLQCAVDELQRAYDRN